MKDQLAHALQDLALAYLAVGELARCRESLEEAFALWAQLNNVPMQSENRANMGNERLYGGFLDEAIGYFEEGFRFADAADNEWGRVNNMAFFSQIYMALGEIDRALESQNTWLPRSRKIGHPASSFILVFQVWTYSHVGAEDKARDLAEGAVWNAEDFAPFLQFTLAVHAGFRLRAGDLAGATELHEKAAAMGRQITILDIDIIIALSEIEFKLHTGKLAEAEERIAEIMALINRSGARLFLPETLRLQAELLLAQGRPDQARETLAEAAGCAREIGYRTQLWQILADQAALAESAGDLQPAVSCRQEAGSVARFIFDHISAPELKESFRDLARSKGILIN
jgi:tetratricopeptide (TPR) repeat protein